VSEEGNKNFDEYAHSAEAVIGVSGYAKLLNLSYEGDKNRTEAWKVLLSHAREASKQSTTTAHEDEKSSTETKSSTRPTLSIRRPTQVLSSPQHSTTSSSESQTPLSLLSAQDLNGKDVSVRAISDFTYPAQGLLNMRAGEDATLLFRDSARGVARVRTARGAEGFFPESDLVVLDVNTLGDLGLKKEERTSMRVSESASQVQNATAGGDTQVSASPVSTMQTVQNRVVDRSKQLIENNRLESESENGQNTDMQQHLVDSKDTEHGSHVATNSESENGYKPAVQPIVQQSNVERVVPTQISNNNMVATNDKIAATQGENKMHDARSERTQTQKVLGNGGKRLSDLPGHGLELIGKALDDAKMEYLHDCES
jgi:hypothetical protein